MSSSVPELFALVIDQLIFPLVVHRNEPAGIVHVAGRPWLQAAASCAS